ncbi:hypothetical protein Tco_1033838 [Tanacetum coccineum]
MDITMLREKLDNVDYDVVITIAPMLLKRKTYDEKLLDFKFRKASVASKVRDKGCVFLHASRQNEVLMLHIETHFGRTSRHLSSIKRKSFFNAMFMEESIKIQRLIKDKNVVYLDFGPMLVPFKEAE